MKTNDALSHSFVTRRGLLGAGAAAAAGLAFAWQPHSTISGPISCSTIFSIDSSRHTAINSPDVVARRLHGPRLESKSLIEPSGRFGDSLHARHVSVRPRIKHGRSRHRLCRVFLKPAHLAAERQRPNREERLCNRPRLTPVGGFASSQIREAKASSRDSAHRRELAK